MKERRYQNDAGKGLPAYALTPLLAEEGWTAGPGRIVILNAILHQSALYRSLYRSPGEASTS